MTPLPLWERLKRRKLVTWTAAYATTAAAVFGTLEAVGDVFAWPDHFLRAVFFLLLAGLLTTVTLAWFHGEGGRQRVTLVEALLLIGGGVLGFVGAGASLAGAGALDEAESSGPGSLVVRPFGDHSPDGDQAYLAEGVAEEVRRALSARLNLPVARGSASGAAHVLDGSVRRVGDRIRIGARLSDAGGRDLWSDRYEAPVAQLFEVEDRIVEEVARRLGSLDATTPARSSRLDPEAHDAYLRGEHALRQRTPASVVEAIANYRAASGRDPGMAAALAREAYAYGLFLDWGWTFPGLDEDELLRRGGELSRRALEVDSASAEAWLAHAYVTLLAEPADPAAALPAFSRAVGLDPTNPEALHQHGQTLMILGRYAEAKAAYHAALAIEPDRPMTMLPLAAIAEREDDPGTARRWSDSAVALADDVPYPWASRAMTRTGAGELRAAVGDAERALEIDPSYELPARSALAAALWLSGERERAVEELRRARSAMVRPDRPSPTEVFYLAAALVRMDRVDEALDLVEASRPRSPWLWFYLQGPSYDSVRDEPRFRRVVEAADARDAPPVAAGSAAEKAG